MLSALNFCNTDYNIKSFLLTENANCCIILIIFPAPEFEHPQTLGSGFYLVFQSETNLLLKN